MCVLVGQVVRPSRTDSPWWSPAILVTSESVLRRKIFARISTIPPDDAEHRYGIALGYAVDRMRDLVRRAILARLCLAAEPDPVWPLYGDTPVDAFLADDAMRVAWRSRWRDRLAALGVETAADRPRSAVDFVSREDR